MPTDEDYLRRAIRLAMNGRGRVEPNPMVGCVIVKNDRVIGEGFHEKFGGPHAEPNALASASESAVGAMAYVTLEPCCHLNKKTPPCAPRLIEAGIARVVVGCLDPNPAVNGAGVKMLREAGIIVDGPLLESECKQLIAPFLVDVMEHRPYVTLKWAETANGVVAGRRGEPMRITNAAADAAVHELRARCDAIAVGTNTVINDDPLLTVRNAIALRPLMRVVLSNTLKISTTSRLVQTARESPLVIFCLASAVDRLSEHVEALRNAGAEVVALADQHEGSFSMPDVFRELHARMVTHMLIEPGPTLARSMLQRQQADRVWIFRSTRSIPSQYGLNAPRLPQEWIRTTQIDLDDNVLSEYLNPRSAGFFAATESADAILTAATRINAAKAH